MSQSSKPKKYRCLKQLICFTALLLITASPAYAYLDPGTGSVLLQALLAGIGGAMAVILMYWKRVKVYFAGRSKDQNDQTNNSTDKSNDADSE